MIVKKLQANTWSGKGEAGDWQKRKINTKGKSGVEEVREREREGNKEEKSKKGLNCKNNLQLKLWQL